MLPYFMRSLQSIVLLAVLLCSAQLSQAQLTLADTLNKTEMLQTLFGDGVFISNLNYQFCDTTAAMREFDASATNLLLNRGVLLSTGEADDAANPGGLAACNVLASNNLGMAGYAPLNALLPGGFTTNDACRISFDITPLCDTIAIKYVFASEEYPNYVNSSFNDVFAFFISGPGYPGNPGTNISVIPGTATPVSINNVNNGQSATCTPPTGPCTNCVYYINNQQGTTVSYNAWTRPLLAEARVTPCSTYTVTIAIADAGDFILDSGVFLEAGGIGCTSPSLQLTASNSSVLGSSVAVEGCVNTGIFTFSLPYALPDTTVFRYTIAGTATAGLDYVPFPDSIVMPAGQTSIQVPITIFDDQIAEGSEFIELYYVDTALCGSFIYRDTAIMEILDKPDFPDFGDVAFCSDETVQIPFTGATTPGMTFQWTPGIGLSGTNQLFTTVNLTNSTTNEQNRQYVVEMSDLMGFCIDRDTVVATVYPNIYADFAVDTVCFGLETSFSDLTTADSVAQYIWSFGDGNTSNQINPIHTYGQHGIYSAQLYVNNQFGCEDSISYDVLVDSLPDIDFTADPVCFGTATLFNNQQRPGTSYAWDFGDGNGSAAGAPVHPYGDPGVYLSQVIATTAQGCVDSLGREVEVYANPVADFAFVEACDNEPIAFTQIATTGTGQTLNYDWAFGDGNNSTQADPNHTYANFGLKTVRLTVTDEFGCSDDSAQTIEVFPLPTADFEIDPVCARSEVPFINTSTVPANKEITAYQWNLDVATSRQENPTRLYNTPGSYNIFLKVTTENGCLDSTEQTLDIYPLPRADFGFRNACVFDEVLLTNQSSIVDTLFNDQITEVSWDLGDNSRLNGQDTVLYPYQAAGLYDVTLTVISDKGCENSRTRQIEAYPLPASPERVTDTVCFGDPAFLMAMAPASVTVNWYFQENAAEPFQQGYSYVTPPVTFTETYWVEPVSSFGCIGQRVPITLELFDARDGEIRSSVDVVEIPSAIIDFGVTGSLQGIDYEWNFGDGNGSDVANPVHEYQYPGIYEVSVRVIDINGCEYLFRKNVEVKELITVYVPSAFTPNGDGFNDNLRMGYHSITQLNFQLYNRWGQMVFQTNNPDFTWNGIGLEGEVVPEGVYVYHVRAVDVQGRPVEKTGTITILR